VSTTKTQTKPQAWSANGAVINPPFIVDDATFSFNDGRNKVQIGSYAAYSEGYAVIINAVTLKNLIFTYTIQTTGTVTIDGQQYMFNIYRFRELSTNTDKYMVIALKFYPDALRTYYVLYISPNSAPLAEMQNVIATYTTK